MKRCCRDNEVDPISEGRANVRRMSCETCSIAKPRNARTLQKGLIWVSWELRKEGEGFGRANVQLIADEGKIGL